MNSEIIVGLFGLATTITSWFLAKRKYNAEVDNNYIDNLGKGLETYDAIISHNKAEIEYLMKENEELRREIAELRKQVLNLTMNICMNLTCERRTRENSVVSKDKEGNNKSRLDSTETVN